MTARIAHFDTREECGLRPPRAVSTLIAPELGGCAVHYGGGGSTGITADTDHARCQALWRAWQDYHMDGHGWWDIAYTAGYCQHGHAMAGRGFGRRTAANGTNNGNYRFYAFVWLGCGGDTITTAALDALDWLIVAARHAGGAGKACLGHRDLYSTECPGDVLEGRAQLRDGRAVPKPRKKPSVTAPPFPLPRGHWFGVPDSDPRNHSGFYSAADRKALKPWQAQVNKVLVPERHHVAVDGLFGPNTQSACKALQRLRKLKVDGLLGPKTWEATW